jgi:hypothetical protein
VQAKECGKRFRFRFKYIYSIVFVIHVKINFCNSIICSEAAAEAYGLFSSGKRKKKKRKRYIFHSPPKGGGLLRRSAFSATLTGRFGMGTVRMGAEGRW